MDEIILLLTRIFNFKFYVQFLTLIFLWFFNFDIEMDICDTQNNIHKNKNKKKLLKVWKRICATRFLTISELTKNKKKVGNSRKKWMYHPYFDTLF